MPKVKNTSGLVHVLPLLVLAIGVLAISMMDFTKAKSAFDTKSSVLSETDDNSGRREDEDDNNQDEVKSADDVNDDDRDEVRVETRSQFRVENSDNDDDDDDTNRLEVEDENEVEDEGDDLDDSDENETEIEIESEDSTDEARLNRFKLKIKTRVVNGRTIVETLKGEAEVENSPEDVLETLMEDGVLDDQNSFEVKTNERNKVEYEIQGTESKRFLGIFDVVIPKLLTVSSETGEVISTNQNVWSRILSLLSI